MACPEGIEPPTHSLEGCCSIQLSYVKNFKVFAPKITQTIKQNIVFPKKIAPQTKGLQGEKMVGVQGFEPWTPWSQTRCATRLRHTPKSIFYSERSTFFVLLFAK
jgi:hypothetical protein